MADGLAMGQPTRQEVDTALKADMLLDRTMARPARQEEVMPLQEATEAIPTTTPTTRMIVLHHRLCKNTMRHLRASALQAQPRF